MKHEIDLSIYKIRTDLAIESITDDIKKETKEYDNIKVSKIYIDDEASKKIGKKIGNYITIEFEDVTDKTNKENVKNEYKR